jgi:succinoglycan biosynthesis transport protein ExoP
LFKVAGEQHDYVESFDAHQYFAHLRKRARFISIVCVGAGALALIVSLLLPKEYTAIASVVIDPPAGNDPRTSITVSPVYLESLRAYELFASSDTLFLRALEKFHLRDSRPLEAAKRRILKVTKVKDTKILQIEATLPDPRQAQALAQFLAEETVSLNRSSNVENDNDLLADAQNRAADAHKKLEQEQAAWHDFSLRQPYETMRADLEAITDSRDRLQRDLLDARADLAEVSARPSDTRLASSKARLTSLESQDAELSRQIQIKGTQLAERSARADEFQQRLHAAQANFDAAELRLRELRASAGLRGERLRVMDPGVIPERPSFPNVGLNVLLAIAIALTACVAYLTLTFRAA